MPPMVQLLRTLLDEFAITLAQTEHNVTRDYQFPNTPHLIQVAIGMRRTGKTFMLLQEIRRLQRQGVPTECILYLNFEDDRLLPMNKTELAQLLEAFYTIYPDNHGKTCYLFLDEIQNVEQWPIVIRRFFDSKKVRIYLTGSSAKLLSKEIATSLRGRTITTEIWPYHFNEYLAAHNINPPPKLLGIQNYDKYKKLFGNYLLEGGFPAVQKLTIADRRRILQSYVDTVIYRDIIERYSISNTSLIKYLVKAMLNNAACIYSPNKFYNDLKSKGFKVAKDTVYDYIAYIEDAFIAFTVPLYSESLRKTQVNPKKIYAVDSGLVTAYTMQTSNNVGRMFENQFYIYLRKQGHEIYYYKTTEGYEIDFFTRDAEGKMHLYQIAADISDKLTFEREERALRAAEKELRVKGKLIDIITYLEEFAAESN